MPPNFRSFGDIRDSDSDSEDERPIRRSNGRDPEDRPFEPYEPEDDFDSRYGEGRLVGSDSFSSRIFGQGRETSRNMASDRRRARELSSFFDGLMDTPRSSPRSSSHRDYTGEPQRRGRPAYSPEPDHRDPALDFGFDDMTLEELEEEMGRVRGRPRGRDDVVGFGRSPSPGEYSPSPMRRTRGRGRGREWDEDDLGIFRPGLGPPPSPPRRNYSSSPARRGGSSSPVHSGWGGDYERWSDDELRAELERRQALRQDRLERLTDTMHPSSTPFSLADWNIRLGNPGPGTPLPRSIFAGPDVGFLQASGFLGTPHRELSPRPLVDVPLVATGARINTERHTSPVPNPPDDTTCSICWDGKKEGEDMRKPNGCEHLFHLGCLDQWVNSTAENCNKCPVCRAEICPERRTRRPDLGGDTGAGAEGDPGRRRRRARYLSRGL